MTKTLSEICYELYADKGQSAVFDFINAEHPEISWRYCEPCECLSPADPTDVACLVCGTPTIVVEDPMADYF